jgi:peptidoglycan/xylan/chitin deacetylase (PgdA/CDA1 family)
MDNAFRRATGCLLITVAIGTIAATSAWQERPTEARLEPIPDKLVVLTFDDSKASHYTVVRPLLKKYGFGATFFVTEGFSFRTNKEDYLTWEQIGELNRDGFEIGNHTRDHKGVSKASLQGLRDQVEAINAQCARYGIPAPVSFAYPGNAIEPSAIPMLEQLGFRFARRGGAPEQPYEEGNGVAYEPGRDHPLLLPSAGDARPAWTLENFKRATSLARKGRIAILQFHGAPDVEHPWVHTPPERFAEYMKYLHDGGFKAIAVRDLAKYVDWRQKPSDPWKVIEERKSESASQPAR